MLVGKTPQISGVTQCNVFSFGFIRSIQEGNYTAKEHNKGNRIAKGHEQRCTHTDIHACTQRSVGCKVPYTGCGVSLCTSTHSFPPIFLGTWLNEVVVYIYIVGYMLLFFYTTLQWQY